MNPRITFTAILLTLAINCPCFAAFPVLLPSQQSGQRVALHSSYLTQLFKPQQVHDDVKHHKAGKPCSKGLALLMTFPYSPLFMCSFFGVHDFYLGHTDEGNTHMALAVIAFVLFLVCLLGLFGAFMISDTLITYAGIGAAVLFVINGIWCFIDFFRILFNDLKPVSGHWG